MDEIKPGDKVTVTYMEKDGTMSAKSDNKSKSKVENNNKDKEHHKRNNNRFTRYRIEVMQVEKDPVQGMDISSFTGTPYSTRRNRR